MKKIALWKKILYVATMPAFLWLSVAPCPSFSVRADEGMQETSAIEEKKVALTNDDFSLFLPSEYEQYLSLEEVKSLAVQDDYLAVADGNTLFLYNGNRYATYTHFGSDGNSVEIICCEFGYDGNLWLLDKEGNLYSIDPTAEELQAKTLSVTRYSAFTATDNGAFGAFTNTEGTRIYTVTPQNANKTEEFATAVPTTTVPVMSYDDGVLYCAYGSNLFTYTPSETHTYPNFPANATDMTVEGGIIHCVNDEGLYEVTLAPSENRVNTALLSSAEEEEVFTCLAKSGNKLYVTEQKNDKKVAKIKIYDLSGRAFTDYEIGSSSSAPNRLVDAQTAITSGHKLIVADEKRIVIYDEEAGSYSAFSLNFTPLYLASDGSTILAASDRKYAVFSQDGAPMSEEKQTDNAITGVAAGWGGDYYLSCAPQTFTRISADTFEEIYTVTLTLDKSISGITADPFGKIYAKDVDGNVYRYTESQLKAGAKAEATIYATLPAASSHLCADMRGGVYAADGSNVYFADSETRTTYTIEQSKLFGADGTMRSFALNGMDGRVYFLYEDYILLSSSVEAPGLNKLAASDAYTAVFTPTGEATIGKISEDTLCITFDVSKLTAESEYFADCSFVRYEESLHAVILSEVVIDGANYLIVAPVGEDSPVLVPFPDESCTLLDRSEYLSSTDFTNDIGYLTNDVSLYKYPYLSDSLTYGGLKKGTQVTVGDRFMTGNGDYLFVTAGAMSGYVPASYVSRNYGQKAEYSVIRFETLHSGRDVTAYAADGERITLKANEDHTVGVCSEEGENLVVCYVNSSGKIYYATVQNSDMVGTNNDFLRIFFGILLLIADALLMVNYINHCSRRRSLRDSLRGKLHS